MASAAKPAAAAAKPATPAKSDGKDSKAGAASAGAASPAATAAASAAKASATSAAASAGGKANEKTSAMKIQISKETNPVQQQLDEMKLTDVPAGFSRQDLKRLFKRFRKLDTDKSGTLSVSEFLAIPELEHNPLVRRVVATFDSDKSGEVDFQEFINALSVFATTEGKDQKFKFTFRMYDCDGDGFISNADLFHVLKAMVGNNLNDTQLQQLVDRTILQGDKDKDGKLNYQEFLDMVKDTDLDEKLKIEL